MNVLDALHRVHSFKLPEGFTCFSPLKSDGKHTFHQLVTNSAFSIYVYLIFLVAKSD